MKKYVLVSALACAAFIPAVSALAADDPKGIWFPAELVKEILRNINKEPRGEVEELALKIEDCVRTQIQPSGSPVKSAACIPPNNSTSKDRDESPPK